MSNSKNILEAFKVVNFTKDGEEQSMWHRVGTAFQNKSGEGFSLVIPEGISVSGTVQLLPKKEKSDK